MNTRTLGADKEAVARQFLEDKGYVILESNFRSKMGEIDLIAKEKGYLVFIEVKYRSNTTKGLPQEAVDFRKMKRIVNTAKYYLLCKGYSEYTPARFDVVVLLEESIELIPNAFDAF